MSKNLAYSAPTPSFLRKLRGEYDVDSGKQNIQIARPQKARLKLGEDGEDDGPVVVGEDGEVIGQGDRDVARALRGKEAGKGPGQGDGGDGVEREDGENGKVVEGPEEGARNEGGQKVAEVGGGRAGKKRKVGKVIGDEEESSERGRKAEKGNDLEKPLKMATEEKSKPKDSEPSIAKVKKKGKKIKLSFDEPDEG